MEEIAERVTKIMKEKIGGVVKFATHAVSYNAVSGELGEGTKAITATLPLAATADQTIGVFSKVAASTELIKVTTSGGAFIEGDFITAASKTGTITLTEGQHVVLTADGTNWKILAGEPKREQGQKNKALVLKAETILSETRPTIGTVTLFGKVNVYAQGKVKILKGVGGGTELVGAAGGLGEAAHGFVGAVSFWMAAGEALVAESNVEIESAEVNYRIL
jgi:hypothetical protein